MSPSENGIHEVRLQFAYPAEPDICRRLAELVSPQWRADVQFLRERDEILPRIFGEAAVCVLPSMWEPCGMVILEAMAQGIPAVAMAASPYYVNKFGGLADLFPGGCEVVRVDHPDAAAVLESAIGSAWESAPCVKGVLLDAARNQIELGRMAYARLRSIAP